MNTFADSLLKSAKAGKTMITAHTGPDDDSIGSVLTMHHTLQERNISSDIIYEAGESDRWKSFTGYEDIIFVDSLAQHVKKYDTVILLDANELSRFSEDDISIPGTTFLIDHHVEEDTTQFTKTHIDATAASTTYLIYDLFWKGSSIPQSVCESLLLGILGDTGYFTYINPDNADVLGAGQDLIEQGNIRLEEFLTRFNDTKQEAFEVFQKVISNARIKRMEGWPPFMYSFLDESDIEQYNDAVISTGAHMFVSWPKRVEGIGWGFVYTPRSTNKVACSYRSVPGSVDVQDIAKRMDVGGGHIHAAGARFDDMTVQEALEQTFEWMRKHEPVLD